MADITPCSTQTVLRIPGSINYKYSPLGHSCGSVWFNADNRYSSDDFKQRVLGIAPYAGAQRYQQAKEIDAIRANARKQGLSEENTMKGRHCQKQNHGKNLEREKINFSR